MSPINAFSRISDILFAFRYIKLKVRHLPRVFGSQCLEHWIRAHAEAMEYSTDRGLNFLTFEHDGHDPGL